MLGPHILWPNAHVSTRLTWDREKMGVTSPAPPAPSRWAPDRACRQGPPTSPFERRGSEQAHAARREGRGTGRARDSAKAIRLCSLYPSGQEIFLAHLAASDQRC